MFIIIYQHIGPYTRSYSLQRYIFFASKCYDFDICKQLRKWAIVDLAPYLVGINITGGAPVMETGGGAQNTNWVGRKIHNCIPGPRGRETKNILISGSHLAIAK